MADYDKNQDWAMEAVSNALNLALQESNETREILKQADTLSIGPGAVVGALIGEGIVSKYKEDKYKQMYGNAVAKILNEQNKNLVDMSSNYYDQIANIDQDLKIIFSPFSVAFMLKNTVVDTISVDMMTATMKDAWSRKDAGYFRNLLINKIYSEAQLSEQMFLSRLIENDKKLRAALEKKSYVESDEPDAVVLSPLEILAGMNYLSTMLDGAESNERLSKYANILIDSMSDYYADKVSISVDTLKVADEEDLDLGIAKLAFLGIGRTDRKILTPSYVAKNVCVSYLPDRVLFIVDNIVISQLNAMHMSEEGYEHFTKKDDGYFMKWFLNKSKQASLIDEDVYKEASESLEGEDHIGMCNVSGLDIERVSEEVSDTSQVKFEKEAASDKGAIFKRRDIDPKVYYLFMLKEFGDEWLSWDMNTIESMIKDTYSLPNVELLAFNKLMAITTIINSDASMTGFHTFEKIVRILNSKDIDFLSRESNLSLAEIVNACRLMGDFIADKDDNVYDNFSEHVLGYLVEVLATRGYRVCAQETRSTMEKDFWDLVNVELLSFWCNELPKGLADRSTAEANLEARGIQRITRTVCDEFRDNVDTLAIKARVEKEVQDFGFNYPAVEDIILDNIFKSLGVDAYLKDLVIQRGNQIKEYVS